MRIVKYDERESVVGDDDGLKRVHLKSEKQKSLVKNQFCSAEIVSSIPNGRRLKSREWCNHDKGRNNFFPEGRRVSFN